jgi:hypothetical protein
MAAVSNASLNITPSEWKECSGNGYPRYEYRLPLEDKAIGAAIEELERQAAENPEKFSVKRTGATVSVHGEIDVDALVMVIVGSMAGGP